MGFMRTVYDWLGNRLDGDGANLAAVLADVQKVAMTDAAFGTCVSYVASAMSKAEVHVYRAGKRAEGTWDGYVWGMSPNSNQSRSEFMSELVWRMHRRGRAVVVPHGGELHLCDGSPRPTFGGAFAEGLYDGLSANGHSIPGRFRESDVFSFSLGSPDVRSLVESMSDSYGRMLASAERVFRERGGRKYKLRISSTNANRAGTGDEFEEYVNGQLRKFVDSDSAVLPEFTGYDLQPLYANANVTGLASDFTALRRDCFEAVATAMKMPTSMLYGNVNNFKEVFRSFMTFAVAPCASAIEQEASRKLFGYDGWRRGDRISIDLSRVKHTDVLDAASGADKLIAASLLTPDETLCLFGLDPTGEAWANKHYITKNYSPVGEETAGGGE